ncbi:MAG: DUF488 family protein [Ferruginibacter sp.]|nr:DUF488 family protein [Bacteroidota bacterium]MBX2920189.1 DUF488 family protein [Ferruginibacter sp.]
MFYRRKIILGLLQAFGNKLPQIKLYKLLLVVTKQQQKPEYDFVPYQYGCYSFSLHADLEAMYKQGLLKEDEKKTIYKLDNKSYFSLLTENDKKIILSVYRQFERSTTNDIIRYTYRQFPFTAIKSKIAEDLLSKDDFENVISSKPVSGKTTLFTIGYEGISLEAYLNKLIVNDVKVLVDVRRNALSMKYGFSKSQLRRYCENLDIEYVHIPEVGIQSELRQELKTQSDYDKLFIKYTHSNLSQTGSYQKKILDLLESKNRIALTCFEANICQCHRKHLSEAITQLPGWNYELKHI